MCVVYCGTVLMQCICLFVVHTQVGPSHDQSINQSIMSQIPTLPFVFTIVYSQTGYCGKIYIQLVLFYDFHS